MNSWGEEEFPPDSAGKASDDMFVQAQNAYAQDSTLNNTQFHFRATFPLISHWHWAETQPCLHKVQAAIQLLPNEQQH